MSTIFKYLLIFILQLSFSAHVDGQVSYNEILRETNDDVKVESVSRLSYIYGVNDIDSLFVLSNYLIRTNPDKRSLLHSIGKRALGSYCVKAGFQIKGRELLFEVSRVFDELEAVTLYSETLNEIGNSYFLSGKGRLAIESYLLSMSVGEQSQDVTSHYNGMLGLAKAYCSIGDTVLGLEFANKFIHFALSDHKYEALADGYAYNGMIYYDLGDFNKSTWNYKQSLYYSKKSGSRLHLAHGYNNRAILDYQDHLMDSSFFYFNKALSLRKVVGNKKAVVESYFNLANFCIGNKDYDRASNYLDSSRILSRKYGFLQDEIDALEMIDTYNTAQKWEFRIEFLKNKLQAQNEVSLNLKEFSSELMKNSRNKHVYISPRNRGEYFPWIVIAIILPIVVFFLMVIQKRLI